MDFLSLLPGYVSHNAILEKGVMRSFELDSFTHAEQTISRFINFYNNERLLGTELCQFFNCSIEYIILRVGQADAVSDRC
jgi:hypothetical protein